MRTVGLKGGRMVFRQGSLAELLALHLMRVGMAYKADLTQIGKSRVSDVQTSRAISKLQGDGLIDVIAVKGRMPTAENVCVLTKRGRVALLDHLESEYWHMHSQDAERQFRTTNETTLIAKLDDARIAAAMMLADVKAFPDEKPSLYHLFASLSLLPLDYHKMYDNKETYNDTTTKEELEKILENGIYYTMKEYREFMEELSPGSTDTFIGTKARGIFISKTSCLVIYTGSHRNNRLLRISKPSEIHLRDSLRELCGITNVLRPLPGFAKENAVGYKESVSGSVNAFVLTDGNALIYSMATGNPSGKVKDTDMMEKDDARKQYYADNGGDITMTWLKANGEIYSRIFAAPFSENGITSLAYLCHTTPESWQKQSRDMLRDDMRFVPTNEDPLYCYSDNGKPVIYMPVYEVNELYRIYQLDYKVSIITYPDMYDGIAHSVRKDVTYYDADTLERASPDEVMIYDSHGNIAGKKKLEFAMQDRELQLDTKAYTELPKRYNLSAAAFFNKIERGQINISKLADALSNDAQPLEVKEKKRIRRKSITLTMGEKFTNDIYRAARLHNMSASAYIKGLIHDQVKADAEMYAGKLSDSRKAWNKR